MFAISSALTAWLIVYRSPTTKEKFLYVGMYAAQLLALMEMPGSRYDIGNLESYQKVQETYHGITK